MYTFSHAVGRVLMGGAAFNHPTALTLGPHGLMYVVNRGGATSTRINKFTIGGPLEEEFISEFGHYGEDDGQLAWPASVALDKEGNVYVDDDWLHQVCIFDADGKFLDKWGKPGAGNGEFDRPSGMVFDREENLLIVDGGNNRIQRFSKDGTFLDKFGEEGDGKGQFSSPWGITIDKQDNIYVADWKNHRVQKFSPDGTFLTSFGTFGTGAGELSHPTDVAVDGDGDVYVADWANDRVQIFAPDGDIITSLIGDAQVLSKWAQWTVDANPDILKGRRRVKSLEPEWVFCFPIALVFDESESRIIVLDSQRHRLQIYVKDKDYVDPQFNL